MSLIAAYTFNEQSTSPWDYSGNKLTASTLNTSFIAGQNYGYAIKIGQSSSHSYVAFTPNNFTGLSAFSMFTSFNLVSLPSGTTLGYICYQPSSFDVHINSSGNVIFGINNGGVTASVTSATAIATGWNTLGCVWDGTIMWIYINGIVDANSSPLASKTSNNNTIYIGNDSSSDTSNTLVATMDCIEFRSGALAPSDISTLDLSPGGILISNTPHNYAMGDLVADATVTYWGSVTWVVDSNNFYFYPLSVGTDLNVHKVGNIGTTARQYYMQMITDFDNNGNGQICIKYPIAGIADYASPTNTITFDYRGLLGAPDTIQNMMAITSLRI